jgi:hypothetical protein
VITVPAVPGVKINGEFKRTEQEGPGASAAEQARFVTPGPISPASKVTPVNLRKPVLPLRGARLLTVPCSAGAIEPESKVTFVPRPAAMHPVPTEARGSQVTVVMVTVTPPPSQFAKVRCPMTAAEADGANVAQASTAKLKTPDFSTFRFFNVHLRKYRATI